MFQDALVESSGRLVTRSRYLSLPALALNLLVLLTLILWPLLHPLSLPQQALRTLLIAPAPPFSRPSVTIAATHALQRAATSLSQQLLAPSILPRHIAASADAPAAATIPGAGPATTGDAASTLDSLFAHSPAPARPIVKAASQTRLAISSGVMAGNKVAGAAPAYPPIARSARIAGTVVLQATISRTGAIENLRVLSGPALLQSSALAAVSTWRYHPYLLNGQPVEVETTINVVYSLGN